MRWLGLWTKDALLSAFCSESMAHTRYLIFAEIAEREGYPNVARLFKAIARSELIHAKNHYNNLKEYSEEVKVATGLPIGGLTINMFLRSFKLSNFNTILRWNIIG